MPGIGFGRVALDAVQAFLSVKSADGIKKTIDNGDADSYSSSSHRSHWTPYILSRFVSGQKKERNRSTHLEGDIYIEATRKYGKVLI